MKTKPWMMLVSMMAGWINRQQEQAITYLKEENKILRDELLKATGRKRVLLNDKQRRRLAILGKKLGRGELSKIGGTLYSSIYRSWTIM